MTLLTERLALRPVCAADAQDLFSIYGNPDTNRFNPSGPYPDLAFTRQVLQNWLDHYQQHGFGRWAIALADSPHDIIGFGGLSIVSYGPLTVNNLGYRFATRAWGKGFATELSRFALRYGFTQLKLDNISGVVRADHQASRKVLEKAGLSLSTEVNDVENAPPSLVYSLTRAAWLAQQSPPL